MHIDVRNAQVTNEIKSFVLSKYWIITSVWLLKFI